MTCGGWLRTMRADVARGRATRGAVYQRSRCTTWPAGALWVLVGALGCAGSDAALQAPSDVAARATSPRNALVSWRAESGTQVRVEREDGDGVFRELWSGAAEAGRYLALGLTPEQRYGFRVTACRSGGECAAAQPVSAETPASHLPPFTVVTHLDTATTEVALFTAASTDVLGTTDPARPVGRSVLAAVDREGTVLWEWTPPGEGLCWHGELAPGGQLAVLHGRTPALVNLDGTVAAERPDAAAHHDLRALPDGRLLYLFYDVFEVGADEPVIGEGIAVVDPTGATPDWTWLAREHFPLPTAETVNSTGVPLPLSPDGWEWLHANSVYFEPDEPAVYVNFMLAQQLCKLAFPAGDVLWCMGRGGDFGQDAIGIMHDVTPLPAEGHVLAYQNAPPAGSANPDTRGVLMAIDPAAGTTAVVAEYEQEAPYRNLLGGSIRRLAGGALLMSDAANGRVFELDASGHTVWELKMATETGGWMTFRAVPVPRAFFELAAARETR